MLDKKKITAVIIAGVVIVIVVTVLITLGFSGQGEKQQPSSEPATPSASASASAPADLELSTEEMTKLKSAGEAASKFNNNPEAALKPADYVQAGFTESLAKTYKPIWAGLFAGRSDQKGARIDSQVGSPIGGAGVLQQSLKVLDYAGSKPGTYAIRVAVEVQWSPWSVTPAQGKTLDWRAATTGTNAGRATWTLTYDQLSQRILKVEQPAWQDLGAEPLFEAMGLPVPTKGADTAAQGGTK